MSACISLSRVYIYLELQGSSKIKSCRSRNFCFLFPSHWPFELALIQCSVSNQKAQQGEPLPFLSTSFLSSHHRHLPCFFPHRYIRYHHHLPITRDASSLPKSTWIHTRAAMAVLFQLQFTGRLILRLTIGPLFTSPTTTTTGNFQPFSFPRSSLLATSPL